MAGGDLGRPILDADGHLRAGIRCARINPGIDQSVYRGRTMSDSESGAAAGNNCAAEVVVVIPSGLQRFTGQVGSVQVQADTVEQALQSIVDRFPLLRAQMYGGDGRLRRFINIFVNSDDIRYFQQGQTPLKERDVVTILPAIAGG